MEQIPSLNIPLNVELTGFCAVDSVAHMVAMLGRGRDFRQFVTVDVERELYAQTPGAQLLSITCKEAPKVETSAVQGGHADVVILTGASITFPLALRIKMVNNSLWCLDVEHNYNAVNIHLNDDRRSLTQNFAVVGHQQLTTSKALLD
jgi:hypothetical protein